jgi:hypothetical protein
MLHDIAADCSLQFVELARIIRCKSGEYKQGARVPAAD